MVDERYLDAAARGEIYRFLDLQGRSWLDCLNESSNWHPHRDLRDYGDLAGFWPL